MKLSDVDIFHRLQNKDLVVAPMDNSQIQPCSIDIRLGKGMLKFPNTATSHWFDTIVDPRKPQKMIPFEPDSDGSYLLMPNQFVLGTTLEWVEIPNDLECEIHGKSSIGRLGQLIHVTAGLIDPGFCGNITLEIYNLLERPCRLIPGMKIGQLTFDPLSSPAKRPYGHPDLGSKYQNQSGTKESSYFKNFETED